VNRLSVRCSVRCSVLCFLGFSVLVAGTSEVFTYWVQPYAAHECQPGDPQLAQWAFEAWENAANGTIRFTPMSDREPARIRLYWASAEQGMYGEARPIRVAGKIGAEVFVRPAPLDAAADRLLRDAIVYLTCLHETGHALGLPHTSAFADIMYNFQYGGDITEYFARYRRRLRTREDIRGNDGLSPADRQAIRNRNTRTDEPKN
jgi:hypothetical protein